MDIIKKKLNIVMDTSQFDIFRTCECKFHYRYNLNKTLPGRPESLDKGTLVHLACEWYYSQLKDGWKYEQAVGASLMKIREQGVMDSDLDNDAITHIVDVMES